jgi:hypothetical protein
VHGPKEDISPARLEFFRRLGNVAAQTRMAKLTPKQRSEMAKKAAGRAVGEEEAEGGVKSPRNPTKSYVRCRLRRGHPAF